MLFMFSSGCIESRPGDSFNDTEPSFEEMNAHDEVEDTDPLFEKTKDDNLDSGINATFMAMKSDANDNSNDPRVGARSEYSSDYNTDNLPLEFHTAEYHAHDYLVELVSVEDMIVWHRNQTISLSEDVPIKIVEIKITNTDEEPIVLKMPRNIRIAYNDQSETRSLAYSPRESEYDLDKEMFSSTDIELDSRWNVFRSTIEVGDSITYKIPFENIDKGRDPTLIFVMFEYDDAGHEGTWKVIDVSQVELDMV